MKLENVLDEMLEKANPSIKYRIHRDILKEPFSSETGRLYNQILDDPQVKYAFSLQKENGYFGDEFHAGFIPKVKSRTNFGAEGIMRFLFEKGIEPSDARINAGVEILKKDGWLIKEKGLWCIHYKNIGLYGPEFIRAALLQMFGAVSQADMLPHVKYAVKTLDDLKDVDSYESITEDFKYGGKIYKVFKKGVIFPEYYHLKILAFSDLWKEEKDRLKVINGVKKLIELSPLREVRVKYKSHWIAPGGIRPYDLKIDIDKLAAEGWNCDNWEHWFVTFENFARMGIVNEIPELKKQAGQLADMLDSGNGFFPIDLKEEYFNRWGSYMGLMLENSWKQGRGRYDLTFRALFILTLVEGQE
ncbi:MAG TPA: hypothetical protein VHT96_00900 [Clostridia bacterium]|nr:hypothetical protein [Clostridia bacterium]